MNITNRMKMNQTKLEAHREICINSPDDLRANRGFCWLEGSQYNDVRLYLVLVWNVGRHCWGIQVKSLRKAHPLLRVQIFQGICVGKPNVFRAYNIKYDVIFEAFNDVINIIPIALFPMFRRIFFDKLLSSVTDFTTFQQ